MKAIRVVTERFCCQFEDMRPLCDSKPLKQHGSKVFDRVQCRHCGTIHEYHRYTDAAGAPDWNYRPATEPR